MGNVYIYALCDPDTEEIRYVGQTNNLKNRFSKHLACRDGNEQKSQWIKRLISQSKLPSMVTLLVTEKASADQLERKAMTDAMLNGNRLTNIDIPDEYPNIHHITWWRKNRPNSPIPDRRDAFFECQLDFEFEIWWAKNHSGTLPTRQEWDAMIRERDSKLSADEFRRIYGSDEFLFD